MFFKTTGTVFLAFSLVSSTPINRRQGTASQIVNDMQEMSTDTSTLQAVVDSFTGTITQELEFETAMDNLNSATKTTTAATLENVAFDSTDSDRLTGKIALMSPLITAAIKTVGAMADVITTAGFNSTVLTSLQTLQPNIDDFYLSLETLLDAEDLAAALADQSNIDAAFKKSIKAFS